METEVFVTIKGLYEIIDGEEEYLEVVYPGTLYKKNGKHFVRYEEGNVETGEVSKSLLIISYNRMEMIRYGSEAARMLYEQGKRNYSSMMTEVGLLALGVDTHELEVCYKENGDMEIHVSYGLEISGVKTSECRLTILVNSSFD